MIRYLPKKLRMAPGVIGVLFAVSTAADVQLRFAHWAVPEAICRAKVMNHSI